MKREAFGSNQPSPSNQPIVNVTQSHDLGEILAVAEIESYSYGEWVLDSTCTFYICFNRESFVSFSPSVSRVVPMGNNSYYKVEWIGNVSIKMFDGKVHTLSNVRYVPKQKRNLIFLSTLDSQDYKFTEKGDVLKVSKGYLIILKGHRKITNIYVLEGNTIIGDAVVAQSTQDITKSWYI